MTVFSLNGRLRVFRSSHCWASCGVISIVTFLAVGHAMMVSGLAVSPSVSCFVGTKFKELIRFLHVGNELVPIRPGGQEPCEFFGRDLACCDYFECAQNRIDPLPAVHLLAGGSRRVSPLANVGGLLLVRLALAGDG